MADRVHVMVRLRPFNETEKKNAGDNLGAVVEASADDEITVMGDRARTHTYDHVFGPTATQDQVFEVVGKKTVDTVIKGYNATILSYGQTGSGKTHSMLGPEGGSGEQVLRSGQRGVIPRLVEELFTRLTAMNEKEVSWQVQVSVYELYREAIHDLLSTFTSSAAGDNHEGSINSAASPLAPPPPTGGNVEYRIREDFSSGGKGIYIENMYAKPCRSASEVLTALVYGLNKRQIAATKANATSSRSHTITQIMLTQTNHVSNDIVTTSKVMLVDLAGSEKIAKTGAEGDRLKEAQMINLSLTLLGNVIYKLTDGKSQYIPYRDSKLTRLLQESFGGNASTILLCHCSGASYNIDETISTLLFAARAKSIRNKPRVNREMTTAELKLALRTALDEVVGLKNKVALMEEMQKQLGGGGAPPLGGGKGHHDPSGMTPARSEGSTGGKTAGGDDDDDAGGAEADLRTTLQETIQGLLRQIEELRQEVASLQEQLQKSKEQTEFHRQCGVKLEEEKREMSAKFKHEKELWERKVGELEAQLVFENEERQKLRLESDRLKAWGSTMMKENEQLRAELDAALKKAAGQPAVLLNGPESGSGASRGLNLKPMTDTRLEDDASGSTQRLNAGGAGGATGGKVSDLRRMSQDKRAGISNQRIGVETDLGDKANQLTPAAAPIAGPALLEPQPPLLLPSKPSDLSNGGSQRGDQRQGGDFLVKAFNDIVSGTGAVANGTIDHFGQGLETLPSAQDMMRGQLIASNVTVGGRTTTSTGTSTSSASGANGGAAGGDGTRVLAAALAAASATNTDLQLRLVAMEKEIQQLKTDKGKLSKQIEEAATHIGLLLDDLENERMETERVTKQLEAKNMEFDAVKSERDSMQQILEALNIDWREQSKLLESERDKTSRLSSEASRLRNETETLKSKQEQQEFVEMAASELFFKADDLGMLESMAKKIMFGMVTTEETKNRVLGDLNTMEEFGQTILDKVRDRKFITGNLESQRLNILSESMSLISKASTLASQLRDATPVLVGSSGLLGRAGGAGGGGGGGGTNTNGGTAAGSNGSVKPPAVGGIPAPGTDAGGVPFWSSSTVPVKALPPSIAATTAVTPPPSEKQASSAAIRNGAAQNGATGAPAQAPSVAPVGPASSGRKTPVTSAGTKSPPPVTIGPLPPPGTGGKALGVRKGPTATK